MNNNKVKPFLRWAGGKTWLVDRLSKIIDIDTYEAYYEPFLGGGSVFFELNPKKEVYLSDINDDLISTYQSIKIAPDDVWRILSSYQNTEADYYFIRSQNPSNPIERAARFIYLNHTSFNGLYRVNRAGKYNVPYGKRKTIGYNKNTILAASERLQNVVLSVGDFASILNNVKKGDFVFLDPPYVVANDVNGFIQYNQHLFSLEDQKRLNDIIEKIRNTGAYYLLTNARHDTIKEIFQKQGDSTIILSRNSAIGGKKAFRGVTEEFLFTNIPEADRIISPS